DWDRAEAVRHRALETVRADGRPIRFAQELDRLIADPLRQLAELVERNLAVAPAGDRLLEAGRSRANRVHRGRERRTRHHRSTGDRGTHRSPRLSASHAVAVHQTSPRFIAATACAAARAVSAMYVMLGFWHPELAMHAPSVRNRFFTSHA